VQHSDDDFHDESGLCDGSDDLSDDESHIMTNTGNSADNNRADTDSADDDEDDDSFGEETGAPSDAQESKPTASGHKVQAARDGVCGMLMEVLLTDGEPLSSNEVRVVREKERKDLKEALLAEGGPLCLEINDSFWVMQDIGVRAHADH